MGSQRDDGRAALMRATAPQALTADDLEAVVGALER